MLFMKYCGNCGNELHDQAVVCPSCGHAAATPATAATPAAKPDASNFGFAFLGFCFPIVGLILWLVWKDSTPLKAGSAGKGALAGVIASVIGYIIYFVVIFLIIGASNSVYYY